MILYSIFVTPGWLTSVDWEPWTAIHWERNKFYCYWLFPPCCRGWFQLFLKKKNESYYGNKSCTVSCRECNNQFSCKNKRWCGIKLTRTGKSEVVEIDLINVHGYVLFKVPVFLELQIVDDMRCLLSRLSPAFMVSLVVYLAQTTTSVNMLNCFSTIFWQGLSKTKKLGGKIVLKCMVISQFNDNCFCFKQ